MQPTLWQIEPSHYSEKVRWALAYKGVEHRRRSPMPGSHRPIALALTRGKHDRFPVMRMADGRVVGNSSAIIAALEQDHPDPPLYPADLTQRTRALELEAFFDEGFGPHVRRVGWQEIIGDVDAVADLLMPTAPRVQRAGLKATFPAFRPLLRHDYKVNQDAAAESLATLRANVDRLEAELDGGDYLVGDAFSVADLTAAALLTPLLSPPGREYAPTADPVPRLQELRDEFEARRGGQWVHEMFARHRDPKVSGRAPTPAAGGTPRA